ncbi:MAG: hypothetical protein K0S61_304 [Anaerocolumna sp.]|nr:hypothetical protein [Anaerocolumna sp.]
MKADAVSFLENFIRQSVGAQYVIPVYQRNYTWKKNDQVKKLLEDISFLLVEKDRKHFIGTIVYVVTKNDLTSQERSVVDGQQRLTTIFLSLYALKTIAIEKNNLDIAKAITDLYLENNSSNEKYKLRLKPLVTDDTVFEQIAKGEIEEITNRTSNVYDNFIYIKSHFEDILHDGKSYDDIIEAMRRLYIVYIILEKEDNPQQIFESINSTGMELTAGDLVRNFIMMNKTNDEQEHIYNSVWKKLEDIFSNPKKLEGFFRFYLASKKYTLVSQKRLYEEFRAYWNEERKKRSEEKLLEDVLNYAKHYQRLYYSQDNDILGEQLSDFRRMASEMPAPFMLELLERLRKNELNIEQVKSVISLINTYLIRRYITGMDTSDIARFFPTYLKNVLETMEETNVDNFVDVCIRYLVTDTKQKKSFMPDDEQVRSYLLTANAYTLVHTRWLLEKIEEKDNTVGIITDNLSIEHIMPQKRSDDWLEVADIDIDKYDQYVNRIGNLTLASISDNSSMGNKNFAQKKKRLLQTSHIIMNQYIIEKKQWGIEDINERTEIIIEKILSMFPYRKPQKVFSEKKLEIYITRQGEILATGYLLPDKSAIVCTGSQIVLENKVDNQLAHNIREKLLDFDKISEEEGKFILQEDQCFNSTSTAADFVLGGTRSGWNTWRDKEGVLIINSPLVESIISD